MNGIKIDCSVAQKNKEYIFPTTKTNILFFLDYIVLSHDQLVFLHPKE